MSEPVQLALDLTPRTWGGKRPGAGRPKSAIHDSPHSVRPAHAGRFPQHVVLRTRSDVPRLRCDEVYDATCMTLARVAARTDFRVVHLSLQHNHIHLIVEADDKAALESGMRAFAISLARRINRVFRRTGQVFAYRYHATPLRSPTQTRNALAYVMNNWRRHNEDERELCDRFAILDRYSSAIRFAGWADFRLREWPAEYVALPVASPRTWLLDRGWELAKRPIKATEPPGPLR